MRNNTSDFSEKVKDINNRLDDVIESSFDGIFITDAKGNALKINKAYETITGLSKEDVIYHNMIDLVDSGTVSQSGSLLVISEKKPVTLFQEFKTGKKALITSSPVFDENNNLIMIVTNVRDITEIYKLKERIQKEKTETKKLNTALNLVSKNSIYSDDMVAVDSNTIEVINLVNKVMKLDATVLLYGETGVGKEVFARYIYKNSSRSNEPFIKINCGAIPESLIESELFGYEGGSFTGAKKEGKIGLFEAADKGTIFLDEIGELPMNVQVKLLRVLQEHEVERIGSTKSIKIDVRIIAATNRNLYEMIMNDKFRLDLYYRLMEFPVKIPPLRDRLDDIVPLVELFCNNANRKYKLNKSFSDESIEVMKSYSWPGNIRELKNIVERAIIISNEDYITSDYLPINNAYAVKKIDIRGINLKKVLEKIELQYINKAYEEYKNVRDAAKSLGMDPSTFVRKRKKYSMK